MAEPEHRPRRYAEEEVARLLERATELQRAEGSRGTVAGGLTLRELEEIASEAGIDPHHLRRAAAELEAGGASPKSRWTWLTGAPATILFERTIAAELDAAAFEGLAAEIQQRVGAVGQASLVGRTLTWQTETPNKTRSLQIVVTSRGRETHIRIEERLNQLAGALFGGLIGGVGTGAGATGLGVALGVLGSAFLAVAFPLGAVTGSYFVARTIFSTTATRRRKALWDLLQHLTDAVADAATDPGAGRLPEEAKGSERLPPGGS
ncbi:MAG: hypothetical protein ACREM1_16695 [Longimicrobiales bacterium]